MLYIRSLTFNFVFYVNLIVQMILWTPYYFLSPRHRAWFVPKFWSRTSMWLYEKIAGTKNEITGRENLPEGSFILAPKHQSFWDAIAFFPFLQDPLYILKRELTWIPFFGWYIMKMRMIPVHRGSRSKALKAVVAATKEEMARNPRQLIIYPEGTRRAPGDEPAYKYGIVEIYTQLGVPVVPVAHVAGLYWPRRKFLRYPGTIKARFLPPIPPGLSKDEFMARLIGETEAACDQFLMDAARGPNPPALPPTAVKRLQELDNAERTKVGTGSLRPAVLSRTPPARWSTPASRQRSD
ncbi:1-acyl-sn-glycerol-3-phosphate acyltransferase [Mesorhizobium sp. M7A.F.Ca.CA.002.15.2.1]|uniref:lysophospholipid acyltransferase family protein n=2 Tax=unclassified Mesorhizobium TaxID=325217 RepID=UPI001FDF2758|nr:1-acyl-sn-glycerol-3-phosphate acyltransferase [Mesorhizobium sp. M7A.F.Ca.CA.002.15.2.1]